MIHRNSRVGAYGLWLLVFTLPGCDQADSGTAPAEHTAAAAATESPNATVSTASEARQAIDADLPESSFQLVEVSPQESGIDFVHVSGNSAEKPFPAANGSGVAAIDCDLDGQIDLYFATGAPFPMTVASNTPANKIYRNLGEWKFKDVSTEAGLDFHGYSAGIAVGDINSDGFPDIYVSCFGENQLFVNNGDGTFAAVQIADGGNFSTSVAFADFDGDGFPDLYVCNYGKWSWENNPFCGDRNLNVRIFCSPKSLEPERDRLLRNLGDGRFEDVSQTAGIHTSIGRAQGVLATDVNADGKIDVYVGNDIHPNFLFLNEGDGKFLDVTETTGTAYDSQGRMQAGMGVAGADVNRDGRWDLFVTNFEGESNTLYLQSAASDFYDASVIVGLAAASKQWVGWGTAFVDFDLDGWKDVIVTNGHVDDNLRELGRESLYEEPALVWKNEAGHFRFLGGAAGSYFQKPHPGRGLAAVDLDNDGDVDIVVTHQDQHPSLLRNDNAGHAATLRFIGVIGNRDSFGCRVSVHSAVTARIEQIQGGGSYLSAHDLRLHFSAGTDEKLNLEIDWPSGTQSTVREIQAGRAYDIVEPSPHRSTPRIHIQPSR